MKVSKFGTWGAICALFLTGLFIAGCESGNSGGQFSEVPGVTDPSPANSGLRPAHAPGMTNSDSAEVIFVGDVLVVIFSDTPNYIGPFEVPVHDDGTITLQLNKTFHAAGKSRAQLEREVRDAYVPSEWLHLTVTIKPQERFYFVGGEVKAPAKQLYTSRMTVIKAIQSCGDFTDFANKKKVRLTHTNGRSEIVNCKEALKHPEQDLEVFPGDKINVPRKLF